MLYNVVFMLCYMLSSSVVSDSLQSNGLQPTRLLCPWNFPGKNTGVGCHFLLQGLHCIATQSAMIIHISPPSWASLLCTYPTPLGHCRVPSWAPCAIKQILTSYLFYICIYVNAGNLFLKLVFWIASSPERH